MDSGTLIREYLLLGLRFDRIEEGYVDSFTGDPALREAVAPSPRPTPPSWPVRPTGCSAAEGAATDGSTGLDDAARRLHRRPPAGAGLRRPQVRGRGRRVRRGGRATTSTSTSPRATPTGTARRTASSTRRWAAAGRWPSGCRPTARAEEIPPERLEECIHAFSSALRDRVRAEYPLPDSRDASTTRSSPTSRGRGSTTTTATTGRPSPSTPTSSSRCPTCRGWWPTSPIPATTPSTAARRPGWWPGTGQAEQTHLPGQHPAVPDGRGPGRPRAPRRDRAGLGRLGRRDLRRPGAAVRRRTGARRCRRRRPRWPTSGRTRR